MIDKYIESSSTDINMQDTLGNTALHYMAMGDYESDMILHAMKSAQLECNIPNQDGNTPLHYLCAKFPTVDCVEVGEHLIARGADVNKQNKNGETPLHKAVFNGRVRFLLAEMLIHHHADLNIVSAQGETPLHYAVRLNREDLVEYLLIEGALSDIAGTKEKKTPLELAQEAHVPSLIQILSRAEEITNFLRGIELLVYRKKFVEFELTHGNVLSSLSTSLLAEMQITDAVHRTTILQNKSSRRPRVSTESGRTLQQSIIHNTNLQKLHLRGDNWIIQNDEVEFIKKLGAGASGTVFKGLFLGVEVAIKVVKKELAADIEDFVKEFSTMYQIRSPHVISLFGAILEPKLCLVMELAHMGSLYNVLRNPTYNPTWESVFDFALGAAEGMAFLHALEPPLLHRDLKTLNLMVNNQMKIKVGDFGLSIFDNAAKGDREVTGTAAYLAPETLEGIPFTIKGDVYAYAIVFWELVNTTLKQEYQAPFEEFHFSMDMQILYAVSSRDLRPTLPESCPPEIVSFLNNCWSKTPEERPDFPTIVSQLHDLQVIFRERKAAWDKTMGASWMANEEEVQPGPSATQTTGSQPDVPTITTPRNFGITKSVSTSQVNTSDAGTTVTGSRRKVSDAGKQSVVTAEFSFRRDKRSESTSS